MIVRLIATAFLMLLPVVCGAATLKGKTTIQSDAAAGMEVFAYPVDVLDFSAPTSFKAGPTGADGLFSIDLPKGQYYLLARGNGRFAYYGRNPVSVPKEGLDKVNLLMEPTNLSAPKPEGLVATGVAGAITHNGEPVAGAVVMVYPDLSSNLKGMGLGMSNPTGPDGLFEFPLPPGKYYLVVRKRDSGMMAGPLRAGDLFGYLPSNPLMVAEGKVPSVHIPVISVPEKVERYASSMFGNTSITGRIVDSQGKPVAGLQALLYDDPMMLNRPLYVSHPTSADGQFVLSFPKGGTYFLAARDELGGTPAPGELYGRYQGSADHSVRIRTGKVLEGVEIKVEEVY
ncbi:MAG: hypothetical protein RQ722_00390 [Desulfuromonadales bacterium]|nr:hypothetical protein [Desulfuromonadales bacterium]